jgi:hypothetical protein
MVNLDRIERRANAATKGPWGFSCGDRRYIADPSTDIVGEVAPLYSGQTICVFAVASASQGDAEFIASARTDVPALIARVRELEAQRDHERALLECAPWATYSEGETLLRAQAAEAQQLAKQMMDERDKLRSECTALRREIAALMDDH